MTVDGNDNAKRFRRAFSLAQEFFLAGAFVALVTVISLALEPFTGYLSIALLYLL